MDANQFLMGSGGRSAKFDELGDAVGGVILAEPEIRQQTDYDTGDPLFFNDGKPRLMMVVTVQTELEEDSEDDGVRKIYVKGTESTRDLRRAVKAAGASGLEVGGFLIQMWVGVGVAKPNKAGRLGKPPKLYEFQYQRPNALDRLESGTVVPAMPPAQPPAQPPASRVARAVAVPAGHQAGLREAQDRAARPSMMDQIRAGRVAAAGVHEEEIPF